MLFWTSLLWKKIRLVFGQFSIRAEVKKVTSRAEPSWKTFSSSYDLSHLGSDSSLLSNLVNSWNLTTNAFNQEEWMAKTSFFHLLFTNWRILASATHCRKKNVFAFFLAWFYITIVWPCSNIGKLYRKNQPIL